MSVGGVGGVGGGAAAGGMGGVGSASPAGGAGGAVSVGEVGGGEAVSSNPNGLPSNGKSDNSSEASAGVAPQINIESNFSTQDFMALRQSSQCHGMDSNMQEAPDLKKLLEWIIALKLLEQMGKQQ